MITDKLNEECAVFGVVTREDPASGITYNALLSLQHRGQEGSGIAVASDNDITCRKGRGLVSDVFGGGVLGELPSAHSAIGHNRYSTTGDTVEKNVQPFLTEYLTGRIAVAHNGNITNSLTLRRKLRSDGVNFSATSDSEVISALIAYHTVRSGNIEAGIKKAARELKGAFSIVLLCGDGTLYALRDGDGYRPLCIGTNERGTAVSSESCALDGCGFTFVKDVEPGELIRIDTSGSVVSLGKILASDSSESGLCIFEYVYFARPDSTIDGMSVYEARFNMGKTLAAECPVQADAVCGVPDSGLEAASGYAYASGLPLVAGFVKNRYIGRSFIYPSQTQRENAVRMKLNPLKANVAGRRIVLVDDSIVRGTTSGLIVRALREAGAKEVHMRISSPPFRHVCRYGTDIDSEDKLIANIMSLDDICKKIGCDTLGYISVEGLRESCGSCRRYCTKCFTGYPDGSDKKAEIGEKKTDE